MPIHVRQISGISLIEILMSFFLLSLMLLSFDVVQFSSLQKQKAAFYYAVATQ